MRRQPTAAGALHSGSRTRQPALRAPDSSSKASGRRHAPSGSGRHIRQTMILSLPTRALSTQLWHSGGLLCSSAAPSSSSARRQLRQHSASAAAACQRRFERSWLLRCAGMGGLLYSMHAVHCAPCLAIQSAAAIHVRWPASHPNRMACLSRCRRHPYCPPAPTPCSGTPSQVGGGQLGCKHAAHEVQLATWPCWAGRLPLASEMHLDASAPHLPRSSSPPTHCAVPTFVSGHGLEVSNHWGPVDVHQGKAAAEKAVRQPILFPRSRG